MSTFRHWHTAITAEAAEAEPMNQRVFKEDVCSSATIRQPSIKNGRVNRLVQLDLPLSSAPSLSTSDSASFLRSLKKSPIKY